MAKRYIMPGLIDLPKICDPRGNLTFVEGPSCYVPFPIARAYWVYDVPSGDMRGGHSHVHCMEALVAVSGSFRVRLDDGADTQTFILNRPNKALLVPPGYWRTLDDFSSGAVLLVLASERYDEGDYVRDYHDFMTMKLSES